MSHIFNEFIAAEHGVNEAIMLENLMYWQKTNKANNNNFFDGRHWTFNSVKAFTEIFPYWSQDQIKRILKSLETKELIVSGNFNKSSYDRTKWYSVNRIHQLAIPANGECEDRQPIPVVNTVVNTNDKHKNINTKKDLETRKTEFKKSLNEKWQALGSTEYLPVNNIREFFEYWTEHGDKDNKMRYEKESTFGISRRLSTWKKNIKVFANKKTKKQPEFKFSTESRDIEGGEQIFEYMERKRAEKAG